MKALATAAIAGLTFFTAANSAVAYSFAPMTKFTNTGSSVTLTSPQGSIQCKMSVRGKAIANGDARIVNVTIENEPGGYPACDTTIATNLSWSVKATGPNAGKFSNLAFTGPFLGSCGPGKVHLIVGADGMWTFSGKLPSGCSIVGSFFTTPPITIVP